MLRFLHMFQFLQLSRLSRRHFTWLTLPNFGTSQFRRLSLSFVFGSLMYALCGTSQDVRAQDARPGAIESIIPANAKLVELWNGGDFTEGVAVSPTGDIYFSDITGGETPGRILKFDPRTRQTSVFSAESGQSNGLMFDRQGTLWAACGANNGKIALCQIGSDGSVTPVVSKYDGKAFNAPNDLVIHPDGSIYFSDPRYVGPEPIELDHMSVYRFVPTTGKLTRVTQEITKPNGVILSPDARTLYVAETDNGTPDITQDGTPSLKKRMTLNAFPILEDGMLGKRRILHNFGEKLGVDGMTVDTNGNIYAAVRSDDRHGIVVFTPNGKEIAYLPTPDLPTNCCFGIGENRHTLYITIGKGLYEIRLNSTGFHPATS